MIKGCAGLFLHIFFLLFFFASLRFSYGFVNVTDIVGMVNIIMSSGARIDEQEVMDILKSYK